LSILHSLSILSFNPYHIHQCRPNSSLSLSNPHQHQEKQQQQDEQKQEEKNIVQHYEAAPQNPPIFNSTLSKSFGFNFIAGFDEGMKKECRKIYIFSNPRHCFFIGFGFGVSRSGFEHRLLLFGWTVGLKLLWEKLVLSLLLRKKKKGCCKKGCCCCYWERRKKVVFVWEIMKIMKIKRLKMKMFCFLFSLSFFHILNFIFLGGLKVLMKIFSFLFSEDEDCAFNSRAFLFFFSFFLIYLFSFIYIWLFYLKKKNTCDVLISARK